MSKGLNFLYNTVLGRVILKGLTAPCLSIVVGKFMDSRLSYPLIGTFVKKNNIDLEECVSTDFKSFNDCFTRQLKSQLRPIDMEKENLIAPCDGFLSVWPISKDTVLPIKQSSYTVSDLLQDAELAEKFYDGTCLVYRLCVNHYHRYCYLDSGSKGENIFIPGKLHTVRPIALRNIPVFCENSREYTILETQNFGMVAQVEVGALLVGKIANHHETCTYERGQEKGMFLYGGSTIVVLLEKDVATINSDVLKMSRQGEEYPVRMGEVIGHKK